MSGASTISASAAGAAAHVQGKAKREIWIPLALAGLLPLHCLIVSQHKEFWTDEFLTCVMVGDPSVPHMLEALKDTINAFPPLYFFLGRAWAALFGMSPISLRLLSSIPMGLGAMCAWYLFRTTTSRGAATIATLLFIFSCDELLHQNLEARCYGLYFLGFAASSLALARTAKADGRLSVWLKLGIVASSALVVGIHYIGGILSAALLACGLLSWGLTRQRKWGAYCLLLLMGWLAVLPGIPFYLAQRGLAGDQSWLGPTSRADLLIGLRTNIMALDFMVLACAIGLIAARDLASPVAEDVAASVERRGPRSGMPLVQALFIALSFSVVVLIWWMAHWGPRLMLGRYLFPLVIAWGWCAAEAVDVMLGALKNSKREQRTPLVRARCGIMVACLAALGVLASAGLYEQLIDEWYPPDNDFDEMLAYLNDTHAEQTMVTSDLHWLLPMAFYEHDRKCVQVLTPPGIRLWQSAALQAIALALKRHYFPDRFITVDELNDRYSEIVITRDQLNVWHVTGQCLDWKPVEGSERDGIILARRASE